MQKKLEQAIKHCAEMAVKANTSHDAMQYAQACANAANALRQLPKEDA